MDNKESENFDKYLTGLTSEIQDFHSRYWKLIINRIYDEQLYVEEPQRFFFTVIHKIISTIDVANILIKNFDTKNHFRISLYILIRSIMADIIVCEYVLRTEKSNDARQTLIKKIYSDHFNYVLRSIETTYRHLGDWTKEKVEAEKNKVRSSNKEWFHENGNLKYSPLQTSPALLIRKMISQKKSGDDYHLLDRAFNYYDSYSKLEHLGILSIHITHRIYNTDETIKQIKEIFESLLIIVNALINYTGAWKKTFRKEKLSLSEIKDRILQYNPEKWFENNKEE